MQAAHDPMSAAYMVRKPSSANTATTNQSPNVATLAPPAPPHHIPFDFGIHNPSTAFPIPGVRPPRAVGWPTPQDWLGPNPAGPSVTLSQLQPQPDMTDMDRQQRSTNGLMQDDQTLRTTSFPWSFAMSAPMPAPRRQSHDPQQHQGLPLHQQQPLQQQQQHHQHQHQHQQPQEWTAPRADQYGLSGLGIPTPVGGSLQLGYQPPQPPTHSQPLQAHQLLQPLQPTLMQLPKQHQFENSSQPPLSVATANGAGLSSAAPMARVQSTTASSNEEDPVRAFVDSMPSTGDMASRHAMWTELIRLKTKSLELQIAEARAKERAAELELVKLQQATARSGTAGAMALITGAQAASAVSAGPTPQAEHAAADSTPSHINSACSAPPSAPPLGSGSTPGGSTMAQPNVSTFPFVTHARSPDISSAANAFPETLVPNLPIPGSMAAPPVPNPSGQYQQPLQQVSMQQSPSQQSQQPQHQQTPTSQPSVTQPQSAPTPGPMTPFDLEAILQDSNTMDSIFSWLPPEGQMPSQALHSQQAQQAQHAAAQGQLPQTAAPADLMVPGPGGPDTTSGLMSLMHSTAQSHTSDSSRGPTPSTKPASPGVKRQLSPDHEESPPKEQPPTKRGKPRGEKKMVIEKHATCLTCAKHVARVLVRAPRSNVPSPVIVEFRCCDCTGVRQPPMDATAQGPGGGTNIVGSTETRKRMRAAMEDDDLMNDDPTMRRCFCDVCQRVVATGIVVGDAERVSLMHMAEVVCASCDTKYQRCTDCGGGGGPRVGIGKWRLKQVFQPGRKTCSLSHSRLGDRPREIGVHVTPTDFTPEQLKEVISRCHQLWNEKTLSRLAVPEMLEIDLPPNVVNPLRNFDDVNDFVTRCWPSREAMIRAEDVDGRRFKRLLGLTWAHSRPRRSVRTVDLEEEYARHKDDDDDGDMSTVLANVKRTNVVIPPGSELINMWGGEWDVEHGSLLISTFIPFEGTDGEDSTALSVGELITKVHQIAQLIDRERAEEAKVTGKEPKPVPPCEHLWVVSGGSMPLIRERMADILVRKRSFVHVEEYLTRHPDFINALQARPVGLHPDLHRPLPHQVEGIDYQAPQPLILVRWLGKDFDAARMLEIKQMEFGGGKHKGRVRRLKGK